MGPIIINLSFYNFWGGSYLIIFLSFFTVVATAIKNANVAVIFSFLHRIIEVRERERENTYCVCLVLHVLGYILYACKIGGLIIEPAQRYMASKLPARKPQIRENAE